MCPDALCQPGRRCISIRTEDFESDTLIIPIPWQEHLILVLLINFNWMSNRRKNFGSIFMACFANSRDHSQNNDVRHPPCKGRATWTGFDSFNIFKSIHCHELLVYSTRNFHPTVVWPILLVPVFVVMYLSAILMASPEHLWSTMW